MSHCRLVIDLRNHVHPLVCQAVRSIRAYVRDQSSIYSGNDALCQLLEPALACVSAQPARPPLPSAPPRAPLASPSSASAGAGAEMQPSAPPFSTPQTPQGTFKQGAGGGGGVAGQLPPKPPPPKCGFTREQLFSTPAPAPPPRPPRTAGPGAGAAIGAGAGAGAAPLSASLRLSSTDHQQNQQLRISADDRAAADSEFEYAQIPEPPADAAPTRGPSIAIPPRVFEVRSMFSRFLERCLYTVLSASTDHFSQQSFNLHVIYCVVSTLQFTALQNSRVRVDVCLLFPFRYPLVSLESICISADSTLHTILYCKYLCVVSTRIQSTACGCRAYSQVRSAQSTSRVLGIATKSREQLLLTLDIQLGRLLVHQVKPSRDALELRATLTHDASTPGPRPFAS